VELATDSKLTESAAYSKVMEFEGEDFKLEFLRMDVDVFPRISFVEALPMSPQFLPLTNYVVSNCSEASNSHPIVFQPEPISSGLSAIKRGPRLFISPC
jgi:hypothetical protein